jgi:hypothetical protein
MQHFFYLLMHLAAGVCIGLAVGPSPVRRYKYVALGVFFWLMLSLDVTKPVKNQ